MKSEVEECGQIRYSLQTDAYKGHRLVVLTHWAVLMSFVHTVLPSWSLFHKEARQKLNKPHHTEIKRKLGVTASEHLVKGSALL